MNPINNVGGGSPIQKVVSAPVQKEVPAGEAGRPSLADRVELSGAGHLLNQLKSNDVRAEKVAAIKAQIEAGTYADDDHKLDGSLDGLLDDLTK